MGQQTSKDELLHQQVNYCNIEGIKSLRSEGAGLEWMDREGKTPLIVACMNPELYTVAKTLIELGANVNAFRPGRHAGTPLHHAAKRGLEPTVKLLLLHGANPLMMNDDCQTPLDVARVKGYNNVVRAIESHICLFSGWLRELFGPGFLELLAPQLLSRKVWVVVLPSGSRNLKKPFKLELAVYGSNQDAQPRTIVALWKANMEEAKLDKPDPAVIISDNSSIPRRWRRRRGIMSSQEARCKPRGRRQTRIKLGAATENDKQQLQAFCNACKGIPQVVHSTFPFNDEVTPPIVAVPATAPPAPEDADLVMAINASLQNYNEASTSCTNYDQVVAAVSSSQEMDTSIIEEEGVSIVPVSDSGPIQYPSIDASPVDLSSPIIETIKTETELGATASSSCVVCLDAPAEGVCVPCGHMAGCMSCLKEITTKKWGCPVCRAKIDQVIRVYAV